MTETTNPGHRQRLRERFMAGSNGSHDAEALLELLLAYAIPIQDVQPLARDLIAHFGSLDAVLAAEPAALCQCQGVKASTATLLKLTDWIRSRYPRQGIAFGQSANLSSPVAQPRLLDVSQDDVTATVERTSDESESRGPATDRSRSGILGKSMLAEAIEMMPQLPDTESLDQVRLFLRDNLHFSASETRRRNATYITKRMFPEGYADQALRAFAKKYSGRQELREVCYYRFCKAEPLMFAISDELLLPAMSGGRLDRSHLKDFLVRRFPGFKSINDCASAAVDAMVAGGIAKADKQRLGFSYRAIPDAAFAFVLHSEFHEPGMYDIARLEENQAIRALLWSPDRILRALYELRNLGIISKVSQIDNFRQFTTKWNLDQVVQALAGRGGLSAGLLRDGPLQPEGLEQQQSPEQRESPVLGDGE